MTSEDISRSQALTMRNEGLRTRPYSDTRGLLTIGYGRNLTERGISEGEARGMFEKDWNAAVAFLRLYSWFSSLNAPRQAALIDMVFNLGPNRFMEFTHLIDALASGAFKLAAAEVLNSRWSQEVSARAVRAATMIINGEWPK